MVNVLNRSEKNARNFNFMVPCPGSGTSLHHEICCPAYKIALLMGCKA